MFRGVTSQNSEDLIYTAVKPEIHVSSSNTSLVGDIKPQAERNIRMVPTLLFYTV
jgi:hypothetical protein